MKTWVCGNNDDESSFGPQKEPNKKFWALEHFEMFKRHFKMSLEKL